MRSSSDLKLFSVLQMMFELMPLNAAQQQTAEASFKLSIIAG